MPTTELFIAIIAPIWIVACIIMLRVIVEDKGGLGL